MRILPALAGVCLLVGHGHPAHAQKDGSGTMAGRSTVYAPNGVVASSQPLATGAGLAVLQGGGNAIDAAVTTAAMLNVVEPMMTGIGGDMFAIIWLADEQRLVGLNASGRAGTLMTRAELVGRGHEQMPRSGAETITVPGALAGWQTLLDNYGTISLADALQPAIRMAEHGFPARLIIPGLYGYVSATKWLREIELTTFRDFDAYWIPRGWSRYGPIKTQSRIDVPRHNKAIAAGPTEIAGVAWGGIRSIDRVEVQVSGADGPEGEWREAQLGERLTQASWRQWAIEWDPAPGSYRIAVRATDGTGETQTASIRPSKPDGATGYHKIDVDVEQA